MRIVCLLLFVYQGMEKDSTNDEAFFRDDGSSSGETQSEDEYGSESGISKKRRRRIRSPSPSDTPRLADDDQGSDADGEPYICCVQVAAQQINRCHQSRHLEALTFPYMCIYLHVHMHITSSISC